MYDIITIGSATIDLFIKTEGEIRKHHDHLDICYHLGNKLLVKDLIFSTGGGGTNTAVAFSRLGLRTAFIGVVGADDNGEIILRELEKERVNFLGKVKPGKTGFSIILPGREDRTILAYKGVNNSLELNDIYPEVFKTSWIYVSTMLGKSMHTIQNLLFWAKKKQIKVALNLSEYLSKKGLKNLSPILKNISILILNKEEAKLLTKKSNIRQMFHSISKHTNAIVVITDSFNPIHAFDGRYMYKKTVKDIVPTDKTGAGDAFGSGFVYGIINGKDIETSLQYGHKQSLAVMKEIGAKNRLLKKL